LLWRTALHVVVSVAFLEMVDILILMGSGPVAPGVYAVGAVAGTAFGLVWSNGDRFLVDRELQDIAVTRRGASARWSISRRRSRTGTW
jgi:hypothetical protein